LANLRPTDKFLCPTCGESQSRVKDTRFDYVEDAVVRLRVCVCGIYYETEERVARYVEINYCRPRREVQPIESPQD
jgi:transcriptional regulator NrdR family protein